MTEHQQQEPRVVAVCTVTGAQGREIVERLASFQSSTWHVRGLTRDSSTAEAQALTQALSSSVLSLAQVDYASSKSVRNALKGAHALYLNCSVAMTEDKLYERIIDCAIQVGVQHIVYSSVLQAQDGSSSNDGGVPIPHHWASARHTEGYLAIRHDETKMAFSYQILRCAPHLHDALVPKYDPAVVDKQGVGWIAYPFSPTIRIPTVSARDVARVALKLFTNEDPPLPNGAVIDLATDYCSPHEMAQYLTLTTQGKPSVQAFKGPAKTLMMPPALQSFETKCLLALGQYMEHVEQQGKLRVKEDWLQQQQKSKHKHQLEDYMKEEIEKEPLETVQAFVERVLASSDGN